ncbi:hypothetical protein V2J52_11460 [Georgenia sp. MJ173]|uniref:hypothetical protein n=1 Tax=Georgenia sunbinii TaxID=3117728 RepID=UPI002F269DD4
MTERDAAAQRPGRGQGSASDADAPATRTSAGSAAGAGTAGAAEGGTTPGRAATSGGTSAGGAGTAGTPSGGRDPGASERGRPGTPGGRSSGTSDRGGAGASSGQPDRPATGSRLGWVALTVAVVLLVWQVVYGLTVAGPGLDTREAYTSVWLLISLVLGVGAAVLGIVAASQRVAPRWPATTALAVGTYVFLVCIATWAGNLISATS